MHAALAATATLLALAFAGSTLERWLTRHRPHELMWTISLVMFALGSAALWVGASIGWSEWAFKGFYLFGAILNVPFLALGTVYLLGSRRQGDVATAVVSLLSAFAAGLVVSARVIGTIDPDSLPQGSAVFGVGPRIAAAVGSGVAATVIIAGAVWSAIRLLQQRRQGNRGPSPIPAGRLALANLIIAVGTLVLAAGGLLNSMVDEMNAFAISLVVGIGLIFAGFLLTAARPKPQVAAEVPAQRSLDAGPAADGTPRHDPGTTRDSETVDASQLGATSDTAPSR